MIRLSQGRRPGRVVRAGLMLTLLVGLATAASPPSARADTLLVLPATGHNVSAALVAYARRCLLERLAARCRSCWILDSDGPPGTAGTDAAKAAELARGMSAAAALALHVGHDTTTAPPSTTVTVTVHATSDGGRFSGGGRPLRFVRTTTDGPEVLTAIADELAMALLYPGPGPGPGPVSSPTAADARLSGGAVTDGDGREAADARAGARPWLAGFDIGTLTTTDAPVNQTVTLPRFGLFAGWLPSAAMLELRLDYARDGDRWVAGAGVGGYARIGARLFAGVCARWVGQELGGQGASGAAVQPTVGVLLPFADWPTLRLDVGYHYSFFEERELDRLIPGAGGGHRSRGPVLALGVTL